MNYRVAVTALLATLAAACAQAAPCAGYSYNLTNGSVADANQVMSNFNTVLGCVTGNAAANGANSDITSLSGLTTPLAITEGGTGNTTGSPSGAAGGSLAGSYPNPTLASISSGYVLGNLSGSTATPAAVAVSALTPTLTVFTGDSGSGGAVGIVPAPPSGSAAAGQVLGAGGSWVVAVPVGTMAMFLGATAPSGWLLAQGQAVSQTTYATLCTLVGNTFGAASGGNCYLPDMRGEFARGYDSGRGVDPSRTFGSTQADQMQGHVHRNGVASNNQALFVYADTSTDLPGNSTGNPQQNAGSNNVQGLTSSPITDGTNGTPRLGLETRPTNVAINYIIKY